jgi:hypothetical protein
MSPFAELRYAGGHYFKCLAVSHKDILSKNNMMFIVKQGTLKEGEDLVQLISSLRYPVL